MSENVKGIILFAEHLQGLEMLSPEQFKTLVLALFAESGARDEFPEMDSVTQLVFNLIKPSLHRAQEKMQRRAEANAENGKKGGRPKKQENEENPDEPMGFSENPEKPKEPIGFSVSEEKPKKPIQNKTIQNKIKQEYLNTPLTPQGGNGAVSEPYSNEFETFWQAYPKKVGKDAAYRSWKAKKREKRLPPLRELVPKIERFMATEQWQRDGGQYIPNPSTWLNQCRWLDELPMQEEQAPDFSWLKDDD